MGAMKLGTVAFGLVITIVTASEIDGTATECNKAVTNLLPCEPFMLGLGPVAPPNNCCMGLAIIFERAKTLYDRRFTCTCLKVAMMRAGIKHRRAIQLPRFCKIHFSFPIDPLVDCTSTQEGMDG
ncbi:Non-specific lipid-transfer protein 1, partial [Mucuna pruriens]